MTRNSLAGELAEKVNLTDRDAKEIIGVVLECMSEALVRGEKIEFRDFGVFKIKTRKARVGRNPKNGVTVMIPEKKVIVWKMGLALKKAMKK